jgi:signal transduction histidine kinase/ActR/RegA family two-component response regulator
MCAGLERQMTDLRQGNHLCLVCEGPAGKAEAVVPFLREGLARGERCVYLADDKPEETARSLSAGGVDVPRQRRRGALALLAARDVYRRGGAFDPGRMIAFLREATDRAVADGFGGLRVAGEMTWALAPGPGRDRLVEYEARLNGFFPGSRALGLCVYDRARFPAGVLREVLRTHPVAVLGDQVCPNLYYEPPGVVLGQASAAQQVEWMIGQLKRARAAEQALHGLNERLAESDRQKDEFLAVLAHELRNPLAPLRNALHVMRLAVDNGPAREHARGVAERQVKHLARLVDDLLDVSRITRGKLPLRKEPVDLAAAVSGAVTAARPLIDARRHDLSVSLPLEPLRLEADPTRLEQVLVNLLTNAAKYTDPGGRIGLTAERDGHEAVLRVRDTGVGIPAELIPRVFEPFMQAERSVDRTHGGLGIGLTLVKCLVEMHGGSVTAHSEGPGKGSEFVVRLPALPPARAGRPEAVFKPGKPNPGRSLRVLVVDDCVDAAESLAVLLNLWGHEVHVAHDGTAALEVAAACRPEVVLLDLGLPGMDGYEVARRLRARPGPCPLLVALTGYARAGDRRRTREAGFHEHLAKPVDLEALEVLLAGSEWRPAPDAEADAPRAPARRPRGAPPGGEAPPSPPVSGRAG